MRSSPSAGIVAVAILAALLDAASAGAADQPASAPARRGAVAARGAASASSRKDLLTPAQVRECMAQQRTLRATTDEVQKEKEGIAADRDAIGKLGDALAEAVTTLDRTDPVQVDTYNGRVAERDKQVEAYQARVTAYNTKADAVNGTKASYATSCENRRYDENQLDAPTVKRKK